MMLKLSASSWHITYIISWALLGLSEPVVSVSLLLLTYYICLLANLMNFVSIISEMLWMMLLQVYTFLLTLAGFNRRDIWLRPFTLRKLLQSGNVFSPSSASRPVRFIHQKSVRGAKITIIHFQINMTHQFVRKVIKSYYVSIGAKLWEPNSLPFPNSIVLKPKKVLYVTKRTRNNDFTFIAFHKLS